jgi:hypothetical protein
VSEGAIEYAIWGLVGALLVVGAMWLGYAIGRGGRRPKR